MANEQAASPWQAPGAWDMDAAGWDYHLKQWVTPKRSTEAFQCFLAAELAAAGHVADIGCGAGAATAWLAARHPACRWTGLDLSATLVDTANTQAGQLGLANLDFEVVDWFDLQPRTRLDGVISLQTLSWLPQFERPLEQLFTQYRPQWIALSSLFYEGDISCRIEVTEHAIAKDCFYNVYAIPQIDRFCRQHGYRVQRSEPFKIDIDLPEPAGKDAMATYTVPVLRPGTDTPERLQISGPLLMNWHFVLIVRDA